MTANDKQNAAIHQLVIAIETAKIYYAKCGGD